MSDLLAKIQEAVLVLVPMILSLSVHEYAHARVAFALGDRTAALLGRMTLNPLSHIDIFGTIFLPMLAMLTSGPFFGWAKPVPVNPLGFSRRIPLRTGLLLTAAAGPGSNLLMAVMIVLILKMLWTLNAVPPAPVLTLFDYLFQINVALAVFNLIPVPPLDGSRVLAGLLPDRLASHYAYLERNPVFVLVVFALLITQGASILRVAIQFVQSIILSLVGFSPH